jgi:hypothetical protein
MEYDTQWARFRKTKSSSLPFYSGKNIISSLRQVCQDTGCFCGGLCGKSLGIVPPQRAFFQRPPLYSRAKGHVRPCVDFDGPEAVARRRPLIIGMKSRQTRMSVAVMVRKPECFRRWHFTFRQFHPLTLSGPGLGLVEGCEPRHKVVDSGPGTVGVGLVQSPQGLAVRICYEGCAPAYVEDDVLPDQGSPTEKPVKKFAADRFDQYLTRCATDGILLGEV